MSAERIATRVFAERPLAPPNLALQCDLMRTLASGAAKKVLLAPPIAR
jgi:hypothetical protein